MTPTDICLRILARLTREQRAAVFWALERQLYYQSLLPATAPPAPPPRLGFGQRRAWVLGRPTPPPHPQAAGA